MNLIRQSTNSCWRACTISRQIIPWNAVIRIFIGKVSFWHIGFISCKTRDQQRREGTEKYIPMQLSIKKHWCQKSGTQKVHHGCVTIQVFRKNAVIFKKAWGFIVRFFFSKGHKGQVRNNDSSGKKSVDQKNSHS